jgi:hypothetical protein
MEHRTILYAIGAAALASLLFLVLAVLGFRSRRLIGGVLGILVAALCLALAALLGAVSLGLQGYRALTREEPVGVVTTRPTGPERFQARLDLRDGRSMTYDLAGDEIYLDARILKWHPIANLVGIHTAYELDRIGGRYVRLEDEERQPRTLYSLGTPKRVDLFGLARRFAFLNPLVDAQYGSGAFVGARTATQYEVSVSTSGLVIRQIGQVEP